METGKERNIWCRLHPWIGVYPFTHSWEAGFVESSLPESNYYSNSKGSGYTSTDKEFRAGRTCRRCGREEVWFWPNRWIDPKYISVRN